MTISHSRRSTTVLALAVTTFGGGALVAGATAASAVGHGQGHGHGQHHRHHARSATSLGIRVGRHAIGSGGSDRVVGRLTNRRHGLPGRTLVLESKQPATTTWSVVARRATHRRGRAAFTVMPAATTRYRLVFFGGPALRPSRSRGRTVVVRDQRLTIAVSPHSIDAGQSATVSGVLTDRGSPSPGVTIDLLAKQVGSHDGFAAAGTAVTGTDGSVTFPVMPTTSTRYRLKDPATSSSQAVASGTRTVTVRSASSLSIRTRQGHTREAVSGDLRGGGHGLAHRRVTLQSRPTGGTTWAAVKAHRTGRHGMIRFHVRIPTASTDYRLVFAGGRAFDASASGVVTAGA
jgi:5-hydroxyisourate hydrolase-like protein (transthyretin family)